MHGVELDAGRVHVADQDAVARRCRTPTQRASEERRNFAVERPWCGIRGFRHVRRGLAVAGVERASGARKQRQEDWEARKKQREEAKKQKQLLLYQRAISLMLNQRSKLDLLVLFMPIDLSDIQLRISTLYLKNPPKTLDYR